VPDHSHERVHIAATPADCFAVATDFEAYPGWANDVKDARVVARDDTGAPTRVQYHVAAMGRSLSYVLEYDLSDGPHAFSWWLVEGDMLRRLEGRYVFDDVDLGTDVTYELTVDLVLPMPGILKRRAAARIVDAALADLKRVVEAGVGDGAGDGAGDGPPAGEGDGAGHGAAPEGADRAAAGAGGAPAEPGEQGVRFDDVAREARSLPGPGTLEVVVSELLGTVPEVRDHLLAAADELLDAARAVLEAADRVVRQQRDDQRPEGGP
jgi:hypothetical protein